MTKTELIEQIDNQLKEITGMTRNGHYQVQQVIDHFRKKARAEASRERAAKDEVKNLTQNEDNDAR